MKRQKKKTTFCIPAALRPSTKKNKRNIINSKIKLTSTLVDLPYSSLHKTYHNLLHAKNSSDSSFEKLTKDILNLHTQKHPTGLENGIESKSLNSDGKRAHDDPSDGFAEEVEEVVEEHFFCAVGWLVGSCVWLQVAVWNSC